MSLSRLVYLSVAAADLPFEELGDILTKSKVNNERDRITGMLCVANPFFIQFLEGSRSALTRTFTRISADKRHTDIELIDFRASERRCFDAWCMKLVNLNEIPRDSVQRLLMRYGSTERFVPNAMGPGQLLGLMQDLAAL